MRKFKKQSITDVGKAENWQRVKDVFNGALEKSENQRKDYLNEKCENDPILRQTVEKLIIAHSESEGLFENPVFEVASIFRSDASKFNDKKIGNYQIIREIGTGGMGAVFLAERADGEFSQQVAVKVVRQTIADSQLVSRFKRERQILASLDHPNIANLIDGGVTDDGEPFLAMEYVEGTRIDEYCKSENLSTDERLKLFLAVCSAVSFAHRNLIVHRDLKPSNILVRKDGIPKLLDFGIAKLLDDRQPEENTQTAFRAFTLKYASPEQISGGQITTASDVYSLGVLLKEILSDSTLETENSKNSDLRKIAAMARRAEPERRYASVRQFAEDVERYLNGFPVRAQTDSFAYRSEKFIKRNRIGVSAAAAVLLSLICGLTFSFHQYRSAEHQRFKAEKINAFLENMLISANPINKNSHGENAPSDFALILDDVSKQLESEDLASQPEIKANLQQIIGLSYLSIGKYDKAERDLREALAAENSLYGEDSPESLKSLVGLAELCLVQTKFDEAESIYGKSLQILRNNYNNGNIDVSYMVLALYDFALLQRTRGNSKSAETILRQIIPLKPNVNDFAKKQIEICETVLTLTLADQGRFEDAQQRIQAQLAELNKNSNVETPELSAALTMLGSIQMEKGEAPEAEASLRQAEKIYRKIFDPNYQPTYDNLRLQAQNLYLQNRFDEAEEVINRVLENYRHNSSPKYLHYATALTVKGLILNKLGKTAEAEEVLREAVRLRDENLPKQHFMSALTEGALGEVLASQKRFSEAAPLLIESYQNLRASQATENPRTLLAKIRLRDLYAKWDKTDDLPLLP